MFKVALRQGTGGRPRENVTLHIYIARLLRHPCLNEGEHLPPSPVD